MTTDDRARSFWERSAPHYDRVTAGFFGRPLPRVLELTADAVAGAETVLEVAAGTGLITAAIAPRVRRVVATDYAPGMLALLQKRMESAGIGNVEAVQRDLYALGYPAASFDAVVAGNVLHLVPDLDGAINALVQVLQPGGKLVTPTFVHNETLRSRILSRLLATVAGQPMHRRFSSATLREALHSRGLEVVRSETVPGPIPVAFVECVRPAADRR